MHRRTVFHPPVLLFVSKGEKQPGGVDFSLSGEAGHEISKQKPEVRRPAEDG